MKGVIYKYNKKPYLGLENWRWYSGGGGGGIGGEVVNGGVILGGGAVFL